MSKGSIDDGVVFHAGFPNAAEDGKFGVLNLDALLVRHRASTYFWRLEQDISELQWLTGDVVVVDRAVQPRDGAYVVLIVSDDFILARKHHERFTRVDGAEIDNEATLWGAVTYVIHKL